MIVFDLDFYKLYINKDYLFLWHLKKSKKKKKKLVPLIGPYNNCSSFIVDQ